MLHYFVTTYHIHWNYVGSLTEILTAVYDDTGRIFLSYEFLILLIDKLYEKFCVGFLSLMDKMISDVIFQ